ncbi:hypothetical protein KI688_003260 [Linnemannia hyalina]|uniref:SET domain-containing protein n=1 Tax=Linnemannia hyalina TaxID=64524 RepID=A0A9P7XQZ0_9FUNG|nr:hypothetical protein KI688_003260 [Linnemannia hyalina]
MSAKVGATAPSPSIPNLSNKALNRLASTTPTSNTTNHNTTAVAAEDDDESGDNEPDDEDAGIIRCICGFTDDDGFTIQCENCFVWQHAVCVGIGHSNVPDKYLCELCSPRPMDKKRAAEIQRRRNGAIERKREKSPSRRKTSVGRPRKQFGSGSGVSEPGVSNLPTSSSSNSVSKDYSQSTTSNSGTSNGKTSSSSTSQPDANGKKSKNGTSNNTNPSKQSNQGSLSQNSNAQPSNSSTTSSGHIHHHHHHPKQKTSGLPPNSNPRISSVTANEDEDLDMESDSQDDGPDAYQFEFSSVEVNIVTSKAVQELFRQVITQFRQAQSRKRSLSLTSGVKLQELVASNPSTINGTNSATPSIPESPDLSLTTLGTQTQPSPLLSTTTADASNVVSMERESLARPLMKTVVKHILHSSKSPHSPAPQYGLFAESNIGAGRFMIEFKGEVSLKSTYKSDPINQYSILATPKPFVLFHPHLNLVVDARRSGNDARFVRRSCTPNTEIKSIVVPGVQDQTVHLGLFAKVPIGKGQEITLDWDWNKDHLALQSIKAASIEKAKDGSSRKTFKEIRKAKHLVASTLLAQTDCACETKDPCVVHQMLKDGAPDSTTREQESSSSAAKGSRPKKTTPPESLRQRYGGHRDRSGMDGHDGKRSADQDTSDDEEVFVAGSSPRRKSPKAAKSENSSSKKARHDSPSLHSRSHRVDDRDSESDSDSHRRRKQTLAERQGSPLKRTNVAATISTSNHQEMSPRELKQAQILIKRMEDKDAALAAHSSKQKGLESTSKDSSSLPPKRSGTGSTQPSRPRDKTKLSVESDHKPESSRLKTSNFEDDNISIGDSGIDSDSNNGFSRRDPLSAHKLPQPGFFQGNRDKSQMEVDTMSQSPATSDSERKDSRGSKRPVPFQSGKKQPYAAVSRGKRIDHSSLKAAKERPTHAGNDTLDDSHNLSGSSSVEGGFVSIVGNTSDEEEEASHRADRRLLREQNMPKETLPVASLKPSVLPCKKVWKMIYMKQRALAEEEAREKAEEMRKKAEEVFDLKMEEEDDTLSGMGAPAPAPNVASVETVVATALPSEAEPMESIKASPPAEQTSLVVAGDVLNLFHEDVRPETTLSSSGPTSSQREANNAQRNGSKSPFRSTVSEEPFVVVPPAPVQESNVVPTEPSPEKPAKAIQKLSLESYHARRLASTSPGLSDDTKVATTAAAEVTVTVLDTAPVAPESIDVEMKEPGTLAAEVAADASQGGSESAADAPTVKAELTPSIPKVKLSLQEYQKQRLGVSQRIVNNVASDGSALINPEDQDANTSSKDSLGRDNNQALQGSADSVDVEMAEQPRPQEEVSSPTGSAEQSQRDRSDYFEVGTSLSTPRISLSTKAIQSSGDYFPVQPFSPISLSAGPTPFSKMTLTSSPPHTPSNSDGPYTSGQGQGAAISPGRSPVAHRPMVSPGSREMQERLSPGNRHGSPPPQGLGSPGWRTPRGQRGGSPPGSSSGIGGGSNYRNGSNVDVRNMDPRPSSGEGRLTSPRFHGSPSDRPERPLGGSLGSPTRERQQSLTSGTLPLPNATFEGGHFGYNDESPSSFKRSGPLSSPTGPTALGPREYYKSDERLRHRSMNGDDWTGYGGMESINYGGYRGGPRGGLPPPPRDRERERERDRDRDHDRDRERDQRDRYERRGEYFASGPPNGGRGGVGGGSAGNNGGGFYGGNRGPAGPNGPGGMTGGYTNRRLSD